MVKTVGGPASGGPPGMDDNAGFRRTFMTWLSLGVLLIFYPGISLLGLGQDYTHLLENMGQGVLIFMLIATVVFQWGIFLINYATVYLERTGLRGLGLRKIKALDFAWGFSFMLVSWLVLTALAWVLGKLGLPLSGDVRFLIPTETFGRVIWVFVSFTAGFCEEIGFRGYLMTRLKILGRFRSWVIPSLISAAAFATCHVYQGLPGFILIFVYGLMFSALFVRTGRLWPCIIAHFFWDLGALFYPY